MGISGAAEKAERKAKAVASANVLLTIGRTKARFKSQVASKSARMTTVTGKVVHHYLSIPL